MGLAKFGDLIRTKLFNKFSDGLGNALILTGTLGWGLSAVAQLVGIAKNDKLTKDQKKFIIPQETADAVINISSFFLVSVLSKKAGKKLVSSGKFITKGLADSYKELENKGIVALKSTDIGKTVADKLSRNKTILEGLAEENITINPFKKAALESQVSDLEAFQKKYSPFVGGMEAIGSVVGAVVASNIITPILRNPIAAYKQRQSIREEKFEQYEKSLAKIQNPAYQVKTLPMPTGGMKI